jgi:outer membrane immunogenic protein
MNKSQIRTLTCGLAGVLVSFSLTSNTALAADYVDTDTYVQSNPWGGFYLGAHAGYGWGERDGCIDIFDFNNSCGGGFLPPIDFDYDQEGFLGGGQLGYNYVIGNFLIGAEVEGSFSDIDGDLDLGGPFGGTGEYTWMGTAKLRAGWAQDMWLIYATGGLALARFEYEGGLGCEFEETRDGWLVGGGAEVKVTERASLRVEYNYRNFGEDSASCTVLGGFIPVYSEADADMHVVTFGFNYLLGDM